MSCCNRCRGYSTFDIMEGEMVCLICGYRETVCEPDENAPSHRVRLSAVGGTDQRSNFRPPYSGEWNGSWDNAVKVTEN